ncbi:MAG TPA: hypothetical protein VJ892_02590 [Candidatus Absconditabacterales bacterium]|nr:hypothetical protein [Candidatus Absconditabacterales bacterium]
MNINQMQNLEKIEELKPTAKIKEDADKLSNELSKPEKEKAKKKFLKEFIRKLFPNQKI